MINKIKSFLAKHTDMVFCLIILFFCYIILFHQLGSYHLIDVDETRYAAMAREILQRNDWITLHLNGNIFYEKPPMYFWMLAGSYMLFGKVCEFAARFPIALIATFGVFYTYLFGRKAISKTFGLISALILLTSLEFIVLSRVAIIDMLLSTFIMATIYSGFLTYFSEEKNQKYFWWMAYFFSALAVLSKGLPGLIVPFGVLGVTSILTGQLKKMFKPVNIIPGMVIFFAITLPWHIAIFNINGMPFVNDYIIKHHLSRFVNSAGLGRKAPFWFFIPVVLVGFLPWSFTFVSGIMSKLKLITKSNILNFYIWSKNLFKTQSSERNTEKLLFLISSYFLFVLLFFSSSSTKLSTYILPAIPAAALITAHFWNCYIKNNENKRAIKTGVILTNIILILISIAGMIAIPIINAKSNSVHISLAFEILTIALFLTFSIVNFFLLHFDKRKALFVSHVVFMAGVILLTVNFVIPLIYNGGENQLVEYTQYAKNHNAKLATFGFGVRSSTLFYYGSKVYIVAGNDYPELHKVLTKNKNIYVITKTNLLEELSSKKISYKLVKKGRKYSLLSEVKD